MTNTTEMPEKIWAFNYNDEHDWNIKAVEGATSYTRTDTTPSKTEVVREFVNAVEKRTRLGLLTVQDLRDVLKEWEDAEAK